MAGRLDSTLAHFALILALTQTACADGGVQPIGPFPGLGDTGCPDGCCDSECAPDDDDDDLPGDDKGGPDDATSGDWPADTDGPPDPSASTSGGEGEDEDPYATSGGSTGWWPWDPDPTGNPTPTSEEVCYPGATGAGGPCFDLVEIDAYDYPAPISDQYYPPIRYFDVESLDGSTYVAPNFKLEELCVPYKGRYQVLQRHALDSLQRVRDQTGALVVKSGFRSPPYNAQQPGAASSSRHMFGDGFDLVPQSVSQNQLRDVCEQKGADYVATYTSGHVHCDWRNTANDPLFFGSFAEVDFEPGFSAQTLHADLRQERDFVWVEASGFDDSEGELTRSWLALDADGHPLAWSSEMFMVVPRGTVTVEVEVGSLRTFAFEIDPSVAPLGLSTP